MTKDRGKKPGKASRKLPRRAKTKAEEALEDFLEHSDVNHKRISEEREKAIKKAKESQIKEMKMKAKRSSQKKMFREEKSLPLEMDLETRNLIDKFYEDYKPNQLSGEIKETPEVTFIEETPEEVLLEEQQPLEEPAMPEAEPDETSDEVRQALLEAMKKRGLSEEKQVSPKEKEKAEQVNMVLNAAESLYTGTRKVTRESLDFAGDLAKGTVGVATGLAGGVLSLVGKIFLGMVRVAGMGYRGVGAASSGLGKGISNLTGKGKEKGTKRAGIVGSAASGITKKTLDFLSIEDAKKGPN